MVVVTDQKSNPADVVLVVEATANLSAYIDVLKKCYIIPSLEYISHYENFHFSLY